MTKKETIHYWVKSAEHDFDVALVLLEKSKYDWCLFMGHLVIEKMLKALWVQDSTKEVPFSHNLVEIAKGTKLELSEEQKIWLTNINSFNIQARYPDYKFSFYNLCTKEFTTSHFDKIKEFYQWLHDQVKR